MWAPWKVLFVMIRTHRLAPSPPLPHIQYVPLNYFYYQILELESVQSGKQIL